MPTIRLGQHSSLPARHIRYTERIAHAQALAAATATRTIDQHHQVADTSILRMIPAIGRGVAGHIPGTQPESAVTR